MNEAYVYSPETGLWEIARWDGEILFRCYSCGYFTGKFLNEHPKIENVPIDGDLEKMAVKSNEIPVQ